ncbi:hypothetical protein HCN44_010744 [Aphidius gifuensis]|uniref:Elongation of very long chain fatty acids protein n=1 Tax=Aphidius gifuensis TaxID=684658 RepID=A0A834XT12_APHGI|nr:elongation of very long chain fatty acids protein 1-like [Aphidius gifuensis]XP_044013450.1 elongation of very long chain fatty acids protein 1-like [Aphidius gifuensis]KAF7991943.1 hypothetical protein HCN44_010744 [Aphidius gifuensis]
MEDLITRLSEAADPRVIDWPFMNDPSFVLVIIVVYLILVLKIGPAFMENRKAYSLNKFMFYYNITAVIASAAISYGLLTSGWTTTLTLGCEPATHSLDPEPLRMAKFVWWTMILKIFELTDTFIFVLRKKKNQTSFLHIYHHAMVVLIAWIGTRWAAGGMWTLNIITNCMVHVMMYMYYLLASFGPKIQNVISPWKPYLTIIQMLQFLFMLIHMCQALLPSCEPTRKPIAYIYLSQVIVVFYLFWEFYKKSYLKKNKSL